MKRCHVFISGRVQGVFFRSHMKELADRTGTRGWVKNLRDGRVEAVFEGSEEQIKKMLEWCRKGSPRAAVAGVEVVREEAAGDFAGFSIIR